MESFFVDITESVDLLHVCRDGADRMHALQSLLNLQSLLFKAFQGTFSNVSLTNDTPKYLKCITSFTARNFKFFSFLSLDQRPV